MPSRILPASRRLDHSIRRPSSFLTISNSYVSSTPSFTLLTRESQALILDNHYSNTKYCITAMNLGLATSSPEADVPTKKARIETKQKISQAKTYPDLCALFGIDEELAREGTMLESLLPRVMERTRKRNEGEGREKEGDVVAAL